MGRSAASVKARKEVRLARVVVRYFAVLRERRGRERESVQIEEGTSLADLYRALFPPGPHGSIPVEARACA